MTIVAKEKIVEAYLRTMNQLGGKHEDACAAVAQSFGLSAETVNAVVFERVEAES